MFKVFWTTKYYYSTLPLKMTNLMKIGRPVFKKVYISRMGRWRVCRYFPEDTTYAVLFMEMVP
jgi:hypothetical protein